MYPWVVEGQVILTEPLSKGTKGADRRPFPLIHVSETHLLLHRSGTYDFNMKLRRIQTFRLYQRNTRSVIRSLGVICFSSFWFSYIIIKFVCILEVSEEKFLQHLPNRKQNTPDIYIYMYMYIYIHYFQYKLFYEKLCLVSTYKRENTI